MVSLSPLKSSHKNDSWLMGYSWIWGCVSSTNLMQTKELQSKKTTKSNFYVVLQVQFLLMALGSSTGS